MIQGTNHFKSFDAACSYYSPYGYDDIEKTVRQKIRENEIVIGKPESKLGKHIYLNETEGRYFMMDC